MLRHLILAAFVVLGCAKVGLAEVTIRTERQNFLQGEPIRWQATPGQEADSLVVTITRDNWSHTLYRGGIVKDVVASDAGWLHEGKYTLRAELLKGDKVAASAETGVGVYPPLARPRDTFHVFSWGVHWGGTVTGNRTAEQIASDLAAHHIDLPTYLGGRGTGEDLGHFADVALPHRVGISLNVHTMHKPMGEDETPEQVACQAEDGTLNLYYGSPVRCFNRPDSAELAIAMIKEGYLSQEVRDLLQSGHYAKVLIDDELGMGYVEGYKLTCYCPYCRETFRQQYGYDIPSAAEYATLEPTIVPDDHPWLNFFRFRTRQIPQYLSKLAQYMKSVSHPDTVVVTQQIQGIDPYPGANLDNWTDWQDVINMHCYPSGSSPSATAFAVDIWRQGDVLRRPARPRPMWLMIQGSWGAPLPDTGIWPLPYAAEQIHMAMASGVQSIGFFTYNGLPSNASAVFDYEWFDALGELLGQVKQLAGVWMVATPSKKNVALLNSFTTDAFMASRGLQEGLWYQFHIGEQAHASLLRAHLPIEAIGEEAIRQGGLADYEALVLMHCHYLPQSVADQIAEFIEAGGTVYCDSDTKVPLDGLTRLPFVFTHHRDQCAKSWAGTGYRDSRVWEPHVRKQAEHLAKELAWVESWYRVDDFDTVARGLDVPGARILYLVNASPQNYAQDAEECVDAVPVSPTVTVTHGTTVYDLLKQEPVAAEKTDEGLRWTTRIPGGGGAIFLVVDEPMGPVRIEVPSAAAADTQLDVKVTVRSADGEGMWGGTAPLQIRLTDATGQEVEFGGAVAAVRGTWQGGVRLARNAPPGQWTLQVRNLADGKTHTGRFVVKANGS